MSSNTGFRDKVPSKRNMNVEEPQPFQEQGLRCFSLSGSEEEMVEIDNKQEVYCYVMP